MYKFLACLSRNKRSDEGHIRLMGLLIGLVMTAFASQAIALPTGVLVPLSGSKGVEKEIESGVNTALSAMIGKQASLVDASQVKAGLSAAGCQGAACSNAALKVANGAQARFAFVPQLDNEFDIFNLKLVIVDSDHPNDGRVKLEASCEFCDADGINAKFKEMITSKDVKNVLSMPGKPKGPSSFTLAVITSPANAEIFVNGQSKGRSPINIEGLKAEDYQVEVKLKGYISQQKTVTPPKPLPSSPLSESFTLKPEAPKSFPLIVKTTPKGANVILDGVAIKVKSPFKAKVKPGAHEIIFSKEGYEELKQTFTTPPQSETITINAVLKKIEAEKPKPQPVLEPKVAPTPKPAVIAQPTMPPRPPLLASNWGGAAIGVGALMTGVGGWLLSLHGEITCNNGETRKTCPEVYNTKIPAGVLLGVGTAAISASVITLLIRSQWPANTTKRAEAQLQGSNLIPLITPTHGGATATFDFRF